MARRSASLPTSIPQGTLTITNFDDGAVDFEVAASALGQLGPSLPNAFHAPRCVPSSGQRSVVAMRANAVPSRYGVGALAPTDPNAIVAFVGDPTATCTNPWVPEGPGTNVEEVITLPSGLSHPGTYPLEVDGGPYAEGVSQLNAIGGEPYGVLNVKSVDAFSIAFSLCGVPGPFEGTYKAILCP